MELTAKEKERIIKALIQEGETTLIEDDEGSPLLTTMDVDKMLMIIETLTHRRSFEIYPITN